MGNTSAAARITYANDVWQYQALKQGEKEFTVQIYWTKNSLAPHAPIRQGATALSPLVDGVATWGKPIAFDVGNLAEQGYTATRGEGSYRGWVWEFYWRIVLNVDGANVNVSLQMTNQANQPKYLDGGSLDTKGVRHFISKEPQPLSQEAFNHIPRTEM